MTFKGGNAALARKFYENLIKLICNLKVYGQISLQMHNRDKIKTWRTPGVRLSQAAVIKLLFIIEHCLPESLACRSKSSVLAFGVK